MGDGGQDLVPLQPVREEMFAELRRRRLRRPGNPALLRHKSFLLRGKGSILKGPRVLHPDRELIYILNFPWNGCRIQPLDVF